MLGNNQITPLLYQPPTNPTGIAPAATATLTRPIQNADAAASRIAPAQQAAAVQSGKSTDAVMTSGGLVANNVDNLIAQNSPLMQRAAARATDQANSRGLLNSSIAAGAAQGAVIDAATPIASQDAESRNQMTMQNAQQRNAKRTSDANLRTQNRQFNAQQGNTINTRNAELGTQASLQNAQQENAVNTRNAELAMQNRQSNAGEQNRFSLTDYTAKADRQTKELVAQLDSNTKTLVQSSASASAAFMSYMDSIQKIQNGTGTAEQKTADIQSLYRGMQDTIQILGQIGGLKTTDGSPLSSLLQDPTMEPVAAPTAAGVAPAPTAAPAPAPAPVTQPVISSYNPAT